MHINTTTTVAVRCSRCGKVNLKSISIFDFSGNKRVTKRCSCSHTNFIIRTNNYKRYSIIVSCIACDNIHTFYGEYMSIWNKQLNVFCCNDTHMEICFVGEESKLLTAIDNRQRELNNIIDNIYFDDEYFSNFIVMYQVFNKIQDIAETGDLYCRCGSDFIHVEIFKNSIELSCMNCKSTGLVYAERNEDLWLINNKNHIIIGERNVELLNK